MAESTYQVLYFPFLGRAHGVECMLADKEASFEVVSPDQNPAEGHGAFAPPAIFKNGTFVCAQAPLCAQFIGEELGLAGAPEDRWFLMNVALNLADFLSEMGSKKETMFEGAEEGKSRADKWFTRMQKDLSVHEGPFFLGETISYADYQCANVFGVIESMSGAEAYAKMTAMMPQLQACREAVESREKVAAFLAQSMIMPPSMTYEGKKAAEAEAAAQAGAEEVAA